MDIDSFGLCSWSFDKEGVIYNSETFSMLNKRQKEIVIDERLSFLLKVLEVLKTEKILLITTLETYTSGTKNSCLFDDPSIHFVLSQYKSDILDKYTQKTHLPMCSVQGLTIINTNNGKEKVKNIISLFYSLGRNGIEITTYSDLWSPVDLDDNYQIDLAVLNNSRLERCLQKIKALGGYASIYPDEGEFGEDKLSQFGFRVITYQGDITEWDDFPKGREEEVKPFIWKYISSP